MMGDGRWVVHRPVGFPSGLDVRHHDRPPDGRLYQASPVMSSHVPWLIGHPVPRAPLPARGVTPSRGDLAGHLGGRYPSVIAPTSPCARPKPSARLGFRLVRAVFAGCCQPLLGDGPSRRYLCDPCVGARTHTPPHSSAACVRYFTEDAGLTSLFKPARPARYRSISEDGGQTGSELARLVGVPAARVNWLTSTARPARWLKMPDCRTVFAAGQD